MMSKGAMYHTDTENKYKINKVKWQLEMLKKKIGQVDP